MSVITKKVLVNSGLNSDFFLTDLFTRLELPIQVEQGHNVLVYSFEGLKRPIFVDGIHLKDFGRRLKIVLVNEFNEKLILFDSADTPFLHLLGKDSEFVDFGYFAITEKHRLVFDFEATSQLNESVTLSLGMKYGIFPHYKIHKLYVLGVGQELGLLKKDVDYIGYHSKSDEITNHLEMNDMKVKNLSLGSSYPNFVKLYDSTCSVPFDAFVMELGSEASEGVVVHTEKVTYNRDCITSQIYLLRNLKADSVYKVKNDFTNELYKAFNGNLTDPEKIQFLIDSYSSFIFVDKYKGKYDDYHLQEVADDVNESEP
ncbi:hypothetical protein [Capnocytophaga canis]|uniref:Uncharacterized protein n=1 Tax=Capnocytophaga canis TaxID=1848903 RepID=A0A0B7IMT7_9FLAO|nr:hypothetical protein [Capnocytophaga canis]CEN51939.1 hypothetical protein CCAND93_20048 [Capnocytophaga canis]